MQQQSVDGTTSQVDEAVAAGGAYEIIRKRLAEQGRQLSQHAQRINAVRLEEFGSSDMSVAARVRVRTSNNCIARDIVQVGERLLFGYNVFIGLKKETRIDDVFALFDIQQAEGRVEVVPVSLEHSFLSERRFSDDFGELYRYYKHTRLIRLSLRNGMLLAGFQIGERLTDLRVFRWSISADGSHIEYIDNRGERDLALPPAYDFEWIETAREHNVPGRHPHVNILDTVFVETVGGDLTIKVENNTEDGLGIYREPVEDKTQSLDDADVCYASVGRLILLKIRPYREESWRHLIFNIATREVLRIDAIAQSCVQLPEDHGVIFPGGYYLQSGEHKTFDADSQGLQFKEAIRSPNGEDVLYSFYQPGAGRVCLLSYNLIEKTLKNPIIGHGYALADNGHLLIFAAESEPTRVHPMQLWHTPYVSVDYASTTPPSQTFFGRIGNAELVRGLSDLYSLCRLIDHQGVSARVYEDLGSAATRVFDDHYWVDDAELGDVGRLLREISDTAELVLDEFEKVQSIRQQSVTALQEAEQAQRELLQSARPENWSSAQQYVDALKALRHQRGRLVTIRDYRYIDTDRIAQLDDALVALDHNLGEQTVAFLAGEEALTPYLDRVEHIQREVAEASTMVTLQPLIEDIEETASGLDLLSELMSTLTVDDATLRTRIIEAISQVYARLNQCKAGARHKQKDLGSAESQAQFGAQFKLFSQSITNALGLASTPEKCDEQLSRLLVQLEEIESQFSGHDRFLADIMDKREEIYEAFESHKQQLLDERQRRAESLADAASRMLSSIEKRSLKFSSADELHTYFAADALVMKVRELVDQLRASEATVRADEVESRFKALQEQALRALRDKRDLYEGGGDVIKLGPVHRFSVNTQELDLTIVPRDNSLYLHIVGTSFYERIEHPELAALQDYWEVSLISESPTVYRAEYLAYQIMAAAREQREGLTLERLQDALNDEHRLSALVRGFASPRYKEGYEKGVHDHDAALLLQALMPALDAAGLLRYDPFSRALAQVFWHSLQSASTDQAGLEWPWRYWQERAQSAAQLQSALASSRATELLMEEVEGALAHFLEREHIPAHALDRRRAAEYLVAELARPELAFVASKYSRGLVCALQSALEESIWERFQRTLGSLGQRPVEVWQLANAWLQALAGDAETDPSTHYIPEAVALLIAGGLRRRDKETDLEMRVGGLLGDHGTSVDRGLNFALDAWLLRLEQHHREFVPAYQRYQTIRQSLLNEHKTAMRLEEFKPRPLSSFVRNRLINEAYLPIIGDNLAKQMGTIGEGKRTDLMGLLMMISPPGYGKTTLVEYIANRLGLIFMKINCPSLGHDVLSLDPAQAPNATARQELHKLNLALEMGNNVMLYLDDIQHTHPEFLQKFISLCDGSRRIEGVWKGLTRTYDMRGRKFCVVMAGNPYTESGATFKIPDMLANRADIYNLGDILSGMDEAFALSYLENALTSNPVLAPLAVRDMADVYRLIELARGAEIPTTDLSHPYSAAEIRDITETFARLLVIQETVLKINQQYIASAAQDERYRREPPFKLQGSYRNMNKMTEKVSAVMNQNELMALIADHYRGEAQLLTTGAEANLLKLAELRGNMTVQQIERWSQIQENFLRDKAIGGADEDVGGRVVGQLADIVDGIKALGRAAAERLPDPAAPDTAVESDRLTLALDRMAGALTDNRPHVEVINQPVPGMDQVLRILADTIEQSILPLVMTMDKRVELDKRTHYRLNEIHQQLRQLQTSQGAGIATEQQANYHAGAPDRHPGA